jgi:hypothetical protein
MQQFNAFLLAMTLSLLIVVACLFHALKQHPPYAAQIQPDLGVHSPLAGEKSSQGTQGTSEKTDSKSTGRQVEQSNEEGSEFWPPFLGVRLKITDSLLAVFTLGLLVFTGLLWQSTEKLWIAGEKTAASQSRDTRILQRAYLAVQARGIEVSSQNQVTAGIAVLNTGRLPARKVSGYANIKWAQERDTEDFAENSILPHAYVLPVGEENWLGTGALAEGMRKMNGQNGYIFVWGRFTYEDGFGEMRFLTFCHRYSCGAPRETGGVGIEARHARQHQYYNNAD